MENDVKKTDTPAEENFWEKTKKALGKFFGGVKNFFVKTGRVNSANCYGVIENIGDFLVYEDHALISAVGMDDVVFTRENVQGFAFEGLGRIRRNKATVKYSIILDDKVVFPEKVREKNDVQNLTAIISISKEKNHLLGSGGVLSIVSEVVIDECDVYGYTDCLILVLKKQRQVGEKIERYEDSALYPYSDVVSAEETKNGAFRVKFANEPKTMLQITPKDAAARKVLTDLAESL